MLDPDDVVDALTRELRAVWGRRVTRIDGDREGRLAPLGELPVLDGYLRQSPWSDRPRPIGLMLFLKGSLAYVEAGSESVDVRRQISLLFGLDDKWRHHSRIELSVKAQAGLRELERKPHETSNQWASRERTWRNKLYGRLARAVRTFVDSGFRILPDQAHPLVLIPDDADGSPVVLFGRDVVAAKLEATDAGLIVITGQPGIGKTALALLLLQRIGPRFRDGVIQLDLRGFGPHEPLAGQAAIQSILERVGFDGSYLPSDQAALRGVYRAVMRDRQMLVLLDNVADADVVRELLLPNTPVRFVVTSRRTLVELRQVAQVANFEITPLGNDDAVALFESMVGEERAVREPTDFQELVRACAGVPYPLVILGGRIGSRPALPLSTVLKEIKSRGGLLRQRLPNSNMSVQVVIEWSLRGLSEAARIGLFALVAIPVRDWDQSLYVYLGIDDGLHALDDLIDDHLVEDVSGARLQVKPLIADAFVEDELKRPSVNEETRNRLAWNASHYMATRAVDIRRGDDVRRWSRTSEYAFLADQRPLLPLGGLPERDDEFEATLKDCRSLATFAYYRQDPESLVKLAAGSFELSVRRGSLGHAATAAHQWRLSLGILRRHLDDAETLAQMTKRYREDMVSGTYRIALQVIRSGDVNLLGSLADVCGDKEYATGVVRDLESLVTRDDGGTLLELLADIGELPSLYFSRAPFRTIDTFVQYARVEVESLIAARTRDRAVERELLASLYDGALEDLGKVATVELLWSFEAPLVRLAKLEAGFGETERAREILTFVARLYGSDAAPGWAARVIRFARENGLELLD